MSIRGRSIVSYLVSPFRALYRVARSFAGSRCPASCSLSIINNPAELPRLAAACTMFAEQHGFIPSEQYNLVLVMEEIVANIISYAYRDDREHVIDIVLHYIPDVLRVTITDDGLPFNPLDAPRPDLELPADERPIGGLGIELVRSVVDQVAYQRNAGRNILSLTKHIPISEK